jgi:hypothetical protein
VGYVSPSGVGDFYDATQTQYSTANWPGSNTAVPLVFATTTMIVEVDSSGNVPVWAHMEIEEVVGGGATTARPPFSRRWYYWNRR